MLSMLNLRVEEVSDGMMESRETLRWQQGIEAVK